MDDEIPVMEPLLAADQEAVQQAIGILKGAKMDGYVILAVREDSTLENNIRTRLVVHGPSAHHAELMAALITVNVELNKNKKGTHVDPANLPPDRN